MNNDLLMVKIFGALLADLEIMCPTPPHKEECEWECRVYRYILEDPEYRGKAYMNAKWDLGTPLSSSRCRSKREIVKFLNWDISDGAREVK